MNNGKRKVVVIGGIAFAILVVGLIIVKPDGVEIADITIDRVCPELKRATQKYDCLYHFHDGLAKVEKDEKFGYIDKMGKEIVPCKYDYAEDFMGGLAVVERNDRYGFINSRGKEVIPVKYQSVRYRNKEDSLIPVQMNDLWGYINKKGKVVIPFTYKDAYPFSEGMAVVGNADKFFKSDYGEIGFIDEAGNLVIPYQFKNTYDHNGFNEGLCGVENEKREWGYIDKKGNVVIPFSKYISGNPFNRGLARIQNGSYNSFHKERYREAFINRKGEIVSNWIHGWILQAGDSYCWISADALIFNKY